MKQLSSILSEKREQKKRAKETERGELLNEFLQRLEVTWDAARYGKLTIPRLASRYLQGVPTKDLYYLKSVCEDASKSAARRRDQTQSTEERQKLPTPAQAYAKRFFWEVNPDKHARRDYH